MHEEPLHLIPNELRHEFEKELGVRIEGYLCPSCQMRLDTEFGGRIEEVPSGAGIPVRRETYWNRHL